MLGQSELQMADTEVIQDGTLDLQHGPAHQASDNASHQQPLQVAPEEGVERPAPGRQPACRCGSWCALLEGEAV